MEHGIYTIVNKASGTAFDNSDNPQYVIHGWQQFPNLNNQQWVLRRVPNKPDHFVIQNVKTHRYVHVNAHNDGTNVEAKEREASYWWFKPFDGAQGITWEIHLADSNFCIDLDMGKRDNDTRVHIWPSSGAEWQKWHLNRVGNVEQHGFSVEFTGF